MNKYKKDLKLLKNSIDSYCYVKGGENMLTEVIAELHSWKDMLLDRFDYGEVNDLIRGLEESLEKIKK